MRRFPVAWAILIFVVVMSAIGARIFWHGETTRIQEVAALHKAKSEIYARLLIRYDKPPVYEEEWRMQDIEGLSSYDYRIRGYSGKQITITSKPHPTYDVSFFFGKIDQEGVWELVDQPDRGNSDVHYTIYVKQLVDFKQGERTITFTDPHYWATLAGRQYHIDLSKNKPTDLLTMTSTQRADTRYQTVVDDFLNFGPPEFRQKIESARVAIRSGR